VVDQEYWRVQVVSDALYDYLHLEGPEYDYLGHFRDMEWICEGHNDLGIEQQIDSGSIPNLAIGERNLPADAEPGNIANSGATGTSGATAAQTATQGMGGQASSGGSGLGSSIMNAGIKTAGDLMQGDGAQAQDFTSGEDAEAVTNVGADFMGNLGAAGGAGSALASLFAL
jgi:hypothetical protein